MAEYNEQTILSLLNNPGIIRNKLKVRSAVNNAKLFLKVQEEFGCFDSYIWRFVEGKPIISEIRDISDYRATSPESDALAKDLKQKGFKFLGSTICYAHMQATGMVNDHSIDCFRRQEIIDTYNK